jgi:hypothetical protein
MQTYRACFNATALRRAFARGMIREAKNSKSFVYFTAAIG